MKKQDDFESEQDWCIYLDTPQNGVQKEKHRASSKVIYYHGIDEEKERSAGYTLAVKTLPKIKPVSDGQVKGGQTTGEIKKLEGKETERRVKKYADKLLAEGKKRSEIAGIISQKPDMPTASHIRTILNKNKK